ncbi:MAG: type II toxin-antitoxin system HicA family toxin [Prevotellaceae bacterium]|jgi:predicted RNA binding protein YcfA (HicA-like mRNA interferase family)|nr:type II toxin-antitoxin system HicA family toxin [Prevotellaceae bacterium]
MKASELKKKLRKEGCYLYRQGGRHELWYSPTTHRLFPIPRHGTQEVARGTAKAIFEAAGIEL